MRPRDDISGFKYILFVTIFFSRPVVSLTHHERPKNRARSLQPPPPPTRPPVAASFRPKTPAGLGMMRTARVGVLPVLMAILSSDETLSNDLGVGVGVGGRRKLNDAGFTMNPFGRCKEAFSLPWWRDGGVDADMSRDAMVRMGERLWDESVKILQGHGHFL